MNERMKRIIFVVNPISGTQSKELILNLLDEKIDKARYTWEVVYTERAGHAVEIAAKAAEEKADIVVAIGGDGTINEIARSLVHTDTALGIIPCGSGNRLCSIYQARYTMRMSCCDHLLHRIHCTQYVRYMNYADYFRAFGK